MSAHITRVDVGPLPPPQLCGLYEATGGGYDWATLFLGDINTGTCPPGWGTRLSAC
jgi:hypothetical protein